MFEIQGPKQLDECNFYFLYIYIKLEVNLITKTLKQMKMLFDPFSISGSKY